MADARASTSSTEEATGDETASAAGDQLLPSPSDAPCDYCMTAADRELPPIRYEFLDHPADVQLHAWGDSLEEAFEQVTMAMFAYMTDVQTVDMVTHVDVAAEGVDMMSLLFHFMDEFLFNFAADPFFVPRVSRSSASVTDHPY